MSNNGLPAPLDQEAEAYRRLEQELTAYYNKIMAYIEETRRGYQLLLSSLILQRQKIQIIRNEIVEATNNTHIGTSQCCQALDAVLDKLDRAISRLNNL